MKFPKNRATVYLVYRYDHASDKTETPVLGVFANLEEADNYAGACEQELKEKLGYVQFFCKVKASTFYG